MDDLYQNSSYPYLPQNSLNTYHQHNTMYRLNNSTFDRPFQIPPVNETESTEPYGWNSHHHQHHYPQHHFQPRIGYCNGPPANSLLSSPRPKITTNVWEDEGTVCYQVDAKGICVARRQDNDMINGTKLLNVVGMSRGKRDGILKNEKGRVVVKVGAMHLKGVWIPFNRARELASKFKIMDILFPLFAEEPSMYLNLPADGAQHDSNEVLPAVSNKCNIVSPPQPVFNHKNRPNEFSSSSPTSWDNRSYQVAPATSTQYDDHQSGQFLHRTSHSDLQSSPVPRPMLQHTTHAAAEENNEFYLLNNHHHTDNHGYDYYNRQLNRSSFSSLSSHHSYMYSSSFPNQEEDKTNTTSSTPYLNHASYYNNKTVLSSDPYTKSSPYTSNTPIQETSANKATPLVAETTKSVGSTTPSSWFSPETPTAVLFQHKDKEDTNSKKRKSSLSIEPTSTKKQAVISPTSPAIRATRKAKVVKTENLN